MKDELSPDAVAGALGRNDGGFGRAQESYYGHPVVRKAHWRWEIEYYFWIGGIMSGSALIGAFVEHFGDEDDKPLVRNARYLALLGATVSGGLLVKDLGRPERFLNMLRIVKLGSPMSVGAWTLAWFSASAGLSVADQVVRDGLFPFDPVFFIPVWMRDASLALSSALMGGYTGVLVAATAIPVWYEGRRHLPALFVSSAAATACSANALLLAISGGSPRALAKLERLETIAALTELSLLIHYERTVGKAAAPLFAGPVGRELKRWTMLAGTIAPLLLNATAWFESGDAHAAAPKKGIPWKTVAASALTLYGGLVLRKCVLEAGRASADDPKPVLRPRDPAG